MLFRSSSINGKNTGDTVNTSATGGTTAISANLVALSHTINPVNDPPISTNDTMTIDEDAVRPLTTSDFGNYSDIENQPFSAVKIVSLPSKGMLQFNNNGVWTTITSLPSGGGDYSVSEASIKLRYIPAANENGSPYTTLTYRVSDGVDFSIDTYTLTINVTPVNDPPVSTDDTVATNEDTTYFFNVSDFGT